MGGGETMAKAKKMLSAVLAALMVVLSVASYVPAQAAKAVNVPKLQMVTQPEKEYKNGDRVSFTVTSPNYGGQVEYRVILWNGTTKKQSELWPTHKGYYYQNWKPAGSYKFTIHWPVEGMEPGAYSLTVLTRRANSKVAYDSFVKTEAFWVKNDLTVESIAPVADITVNEGEKVTLPENVTLNMSDKTTKEAKVTWEAVDTAKPGEYTVNGTVEGTDKKATVKVVVKAVDLKVESVSAIKATTLQVTYNKAVDTAKAKVVLYKGIAPVAVAKTTWDDAKKVVTLQTVIKLTKGEYTIKTNGLDKAVEDFKTTVEDEKIAKLEIATSSVQDVANSTVAYTMQNQYGEDIAASAATVTATAVNIMTGAKLTTSFLADGTLVLTDADTMTDATKSEKVVVTMTYNATGLTATATLPVVAAAKLGEIVVSDPTMPATTKRITVGDTTDTLVIPYTAVDQYGQAVKLTASKNGATAIEAADGVKIISSNSAIIDATNIKTDANSKLTFQTGATAGTAVLTFVNIATGKSTSLSIVINEVAAAKTFTLVQPTTLLTVNKGVTVDYTVTNQFDELVAKKNFTNTYRTNSNITWVSTNPAVVNPSADITYTAQNELVITPKAKGITVLTPYVKGVPQTAITLDVQDEIKPAKIVGVKNMPLFSVEDGVITIKASNLSIVDQYGYAVTLPTGWKAIVSLKDATETSFDLGDKSGFTTAADATVDLTADSSTGYAQLKGLAAIGSEIISVVLNDGSANITTSAYEFTVSTVAADKVTGYSIEDTGKFFADKDNNVTTNNKTISVVGKDVAGNEVALTSGTVTQITSDNVNFKVSGMDVWAIAKGTANISAWIGTDKVATLAVTAVDDAKIPTTVAFAKASNDVTGAAASTATVSVVIEDQYGNTVSGDAGKWYGSDDNVATVNAANGQLTLVGTGKIALTYISSNGIKAETVVNVTVTP